MYPCTHEPEIDIDIFKNLQQLRAYYEPLLLQRSRKTWIGKD